MLYAADKAAFLVINHWQNGPWLDRFFLTATDFGTAWLALGACVVMLLLHSASPRSFAPLLFGAAVLIAPLALVDLGLKRLIARPRPPLELGDLARVVGPRLEMYSFPSGHAFTAAAVLGFLWVVDRRLAWIWLPCTLLVCLSRPYLGVHFPSDVIAGAVLGFSTAYASARALELGIKR